MSNVKGKNLDGPVDRSHNQAYLITQDLTMTQLLHKLDCGVRLIRGSIMGDKAWLSAHSQHILLDGQASDQVPVLSGVPQGLVLGIGTNTSLNLFYSLLQYITETDPM